jgi:hypothetical protein
MPLATFSRLADSGSLMAHRLPFARCRKNSLTTSSVRPHILCNLPSLSLILVSSTTTKPAGKVTRRQKPLRLAKAPSACWPMPARSPAYRETISRFTRFQRRSFIPVSVAAVLAPRVLHSKPSDITAAVATLIETASQSFASPASVPPLNGVVQFTVVQNRYLSVETAKKPSRQADAIFSSR